MAKTVPDDKDPQEVAARAFDCGYSCAEAMVLALSPEDGRAPADPQRAAGALGGGIARAGLTCGCLTGAAIAVGFRLGRTSADDGESKARAYAVVANIVRRFEAAFGTTDCRRLTGLDFNCENPRAELDRVHDEVCAKLVRFTAAAAAEELAAAEPEGE
jgi:C_GCAxxG_C_C family probable redox protein